MAHSSSSLHLPLTAEPQQERDLMAALADPEASKAKRRKAMQLFAKMSKKYTDFALHRRLPRNADVRSVALSTESQFPDRTTRLPGAIVFGDQQRLRVDMRWTQLFRSLDMRGSEVPYFEIDDVYNAVTFKVYQSGEQIELGTVEAEQSIFKLDIVAGGLQWNRFWEQWENLWQAGDGLNAMQARYGQKQARIAYEVVTDSTGISTTSYVDADNSGATSIENDVATINATIQDIKDAIYQATSPSGEQTDEEIEGATFYLLYNSSTAGYPDRVAKALEADLNTANDNMSVGRVLDPVVPIGSRHVPTGNWFIVLPGRKNVAAVGRDLQIFDYNDPRVAGIAEGRVGQGAYKLVRGDANQVRKMALS